MVMSRPQKEYAFFAGFSGQRGEQTWKERMRQLVKLGFIRAEGGPHGELSYVLIVDPIKVIDGHVQRKTTGLRKDYVNTLFERASQVEAPDLDGAAAAKMP